jgi:uncharacterized repeat protein (TIGR01451 family)
MPTSLTPRAGLNLPGGRRPRRLRPALEVLEDRTLLSGVPTWVEQGPASEINSGSHVGPNSPVSGALESITVNPNNPAQILVGTANGGVWRTTNADPNNPAAISWTPLTDQLASLSIGAVAFDPNDASGNTFYAGTGLWTSGPDGGAAVGLYKTTDAGAHWALLGGSVLAGHRVKALALGGSTILVGTIDGTGGSASNFTGYKAHGGGLYRSSDGGTTFALVAGTGPTDLPAGAVPSVLADPNHAQRFYASVSGHGVYRSDDGGATWAPVNTGLATSTVLQGNDDVELAAQKNGGGTTLFAGIATGKTMNGVFTSADGGAAWTALAPLPAGAAAGLGGAFAEYFQLTADPDAVRHPGVVYLEANGVFRYDPSGAGSWVAIDGTGTRDDTGPHVDARDLKFLGTNTLLESDDGGLFFLNNPTAAATSDWQSFNGNLADIELFSAAYDSTNRVVFGSAQDNGSPTQDAANSLAWTDAGGGDGWLSQVNTTSLGGDVFRYYRINSISPKIERFRFNGGNENVNEVSFPITGATVDASGTVTITSANHGLQTGDRVLVAGLLGITGLSAFLPFPVTVLDANRFSLNGSRGSGTYLGGGSWQRTGPISTITGVAGQPITITSPNHRLSTGDQVTLAVSGNAALDQSSFYITVLDTNTFSLNGTSAAGGSTSGGSWRLSNYVLLKSAPGAVNQSGLNSKDQGDVSSRPFVLNSVGPRRMLLGGFGVYEDAATNAAGGFAGDVVADITGTVGPVNPATGELVAGPVTALAYGGQRAGAAEPNVAFVGAFDGHLFFRGESGASFTDASGGLGTTGSGHQIYSIALDPKDWRRVYAVKDNQLWFTPDVTNLAAPGNAWTAIGGGSNDNLGQLLTAAVSTTALRSVTVVNGNAVVGALGGVFQTSAPPAGGGAATTWSAFGHGLPHVVVEQVRYDAGDDLLLAATFGRGAWTLPNATGAPDVDVTAKADAAAVSAGGTAGFTVTLVNEGTTTATGVTLADPLPAGAGRDVNWKIDAGTGNPSDFTIAGAVGSQTLTLAPAVNTLAGGQSIAVHITGVTTAADAPSPTFSGTLANTATVNAGNESASEQNQQAGATVTVQASPPPQPPPTVTPPSTPSAPPPTVAAPQVLRARRTGAVQGFVLTFSEALDAASAQDLGHYALLVPGKGRKHKAHAISLRSAVYDPGAHTVTLTVGKVPAGVKKGMLEAFDIADVSGTVLDGNNDGLPGGTAVFTVPLQPGRHR